MAKTSSKVKDQYIRDADYHLEEAKETPGTSRANNIWRLHEFQKAADSYALAGKKDEAYRCLREAEQLELKFHKDELKERQSEGEEIDKRREASSYKTSQEEGRKKIDRMLGVSKGTGLVGKIARALGLGVFIIIGIYFLSSNNITGNVVVANLSSVSSSFLVNFILVGILGLVCYSYLK